ncbi:MAG: hypothetical protein H0U28_10090, partial [Nocardioidaceae bacterium]|nr:hypothetical protein [Nocardioidaceae bacterium]
MTETIPRHPPDASTAASRAVVVPEKPALEGLEDKWSQSWEDDQVYAFDRSK